MSSAAQDCIHYEDYIHWVGRTDTPGYAQDVAVRSSFAFIADGYNGLQVIDVSTPSTPVLVGNVDTPDRAWGLDVFGDYVYVADGESGLLVVNITDAHNPEIAGSVDTPSSARGVAVAGNYAYVADWNGLQVVDISDPLSLDLVGSVDTPGSSWNVFIVDDYAYVADGSSGLQIVDISDPFSPEIIASAETPGYAREVVVTDNFAYIADDDSGLQVIYVSNPLAPFLIGSIDTPSSARGVAISDDYAFVADWWSGIQAIDISDPSEPILVGRVSTMGSAMGVVVVNDIAYVADGTGLQVVDVSNLSSAELLGHAEAISSADITIVEDYAYVAGGGLSVVDVTDSANPILVSSIATPETAFGVDVVDNRAFVVYAEVAIGHGGLAVVDISYPYLLEIIGSFDIASINVEPKVKVNDGYAYVAAGTSDLLIVDVSDPSSLSLVSNVEIQGRAYDVAIANGHAFIASGSEGLHVIDIADPTAPLIVTSLLTPGWVLSVEVVGDYGYLPVNSGSLLVADLSEPTTPFIASAVRTANCSDVAIHGNIAYVVSDNVLQLVNVSDPLLPNLFGSVEGGWGQASVAVSAENAYVGAYENGLYVAALQCEGESPTILSISDVPIDQGGCVYIDVQASIYDDTPLRSTEFYTVQRRDFGNWVTLMSGGAYGESHYYFEARTLADSTAEDSGLTEFRVIAFMDEGHFASESAWGYSVDNIAPGPPEGFIVHVDTDATHLSWQPSDAEDFQYFNVYRGENEDFEPSEETLVHQTAETAWVDPDNGRYYKLSAVDVAGNEGEVVGPETVVDAPELPTQYALSPCMPNPFNPSTTLRFSLPADAEVSLSIYDLSGRRIVELISEDMPQGNHEVEWRGKDSGGLPVASGVYFYRLEADDFVDTRKMTLIK